MPPRDRHSVPHVCFFTAAMLSLQRATIAAGPAQTFQATLFADGGVLFSYHTMDPNSWNVWRETESVGYEDRAGAVGGQISFGAVPASDTSYHIPPVCTEPPACPTHSTGTVDILTGCTCDAGYHGVVLAAPTFPYYIGSCQGAATVGCSIAFTNGAIAEFPEGSTTRADFEATFKVQLAASLNAEIEEEAHRITADQVANIRLAAGSIVVSFELVLPSTVPVATVTDGLTAARAAGTTISVAGLEADSASLTPATGATFADSVTIAPLPVQPSVAAACPSDHATTDHAFVNIAATGTKLLDTSNVSCQSLAIFVGQVLLISYPQPHTTSFVRTWTPVICYSAVTQNDMGWSNADQLHQGHEWHVQLEWIRAHQYVGRVQCSCCTNWQRGHECGIDIIDSNAGGLLRVR